MDVSRQEKCDSTKQEIHVLRDRVDLLRKALARCVRNALGKICPYPEV
jgi:hypothetical protein